MRAMWEKAWVSVRNSFVTVPEAEINGMAWGQEKGEEGEGRSWIRWRKSCWAKGGMAAEFTAWSISDFSDWARVNRRGVKRGQSSSK